MTSWESVVCRYWIAPCQEMKWPAVSLSGGSYWETYRCSFHAYPGTWRIMWSRPSVSVSRSSGSSNQMYRHESWSTGKVLWNPTTVVWGWKKDLTRLIVWRSLLGVLFECAMTWFWMLALLLVDSICLDLAALDIKSNENVEKLKVVYFKWRKMNQTTSP